MTEIIAIANQKGGVGKMTPTLNLGYSLMKLGKKVLIIDFDGQANLTTCFGIEESQRNRNEYRTSYDSENGRGRAFRKIGVHRIE